ncbi:uncharacterized protein LOC123672534 isoform X2 [Harmonia axyridis]|uniref:uncharacterized protein LOC123672534 isoform X2 n=1 Tax=Harmonia axyridis TaxID=115357 RepID=UPI001E27836F|nr:uncharacterized protein LOC123672534 isoform X2 [Harmonia axyridis]
MSIIQAARRLKEQYTKNVNSFDVTQLEKELMLFKNTIKTNNDQLAKTLSDVETAKSKILELSKLLQEVDFENSDISNDIAETEEYLVSMERENWKLKQNAEGNKGRIGVLEAENKVLLYKFIEQEAENAKLKKELSQLNTELNDISVFAGEYLGSDKRLWSIMSKVQEIQREVDEMQKSVLNESRHEFPREMGAITEYYKNKLKRIEQDKMLVLNHLRDLKVEHEVLQNSIDGGTSEASGIIAELVAVQCKENCDFFRQNIEDQEVRLKVLGILLDKEKTYNFKLLSFLENAQKKNQDLLSEADMMPVEVKDEIVFLDNSGETGIVE